jgi:uncharacterized membrane protein YoaK (UPF0700 family)
MLSAQAYSFRQQSKLAISLSWIGGYTNVVAFMGCHTMVSHVTGSTTWFGQAVAGRHWGTAFFMGFILVTFWLGAVLSALMTEGARRRGWRSKYILPLAVEAVLLGFFAIGLEFFMKGVTWSGMGEVGGHSAMGLLLIGMGSMAMGIQNATITRVSGNVVRTTHLTGVMTDLGLESVQYFFWWRDKMRSRREGRRGRLIRVSARHPSFLRLALLGSIFGSFLLGAVVGTLAYSWQPDYAMAAPVLFLLFIVWMDWRKPIADTRELDLLGDPELRALGIVQAILPAGLGIYRVHPKLAGKESVVDFAGWVDRLPERWRVIILAITPLVRLSGNAAMDLEAAVNRLSAAGKKLILCGVVTKQYKELERSGLLEKIGAENVCPDLEFAVALGVEALRPGVAL